jgi:hypothetical protein
MNERLVDGHTGMEGLPMFRRAGKVAGFRCSGEPPLKAAGQAVRASDPVSIWGTVSAGTALE